jgi:hypothetical protein
MAARKPKKKAKKAKKSVRKAVKRAAKKPVKARKRKAPARKAAPKRAPKAKSKAPVRKKKQIVGEGDYEATRAFDSDQAEFVAKNKTRIPALGQQAEKALEGPEGASLRAAEATAAARSRDTF